MRCLLFVILLFGISAVGNAQVTSLPSLAEVKAKGAVQLSADELKQLIPGAKVVSHTGAGTTRRWENKPDGTFTASSDNVGVGGSVRSWPTTGNGSWRVADNGTFCVDIKWNTLAEKWCRYIFKSGDKYYGYFKLDDSAQAQEFEFSR